MVDKINYKFYFCVVVVVIGILSYAFVKFITENFSYFGDITENYKLAASMVFFAILMGEVFGDSNLQISSFKKLKMLRAVPTPGKDAILLINGIVLVGVMLSNYFIRFVYIQKFELEPILIAKYPFLVAGYLLIAEILIFQILLTLVTALVLNLRYSFAFYSTLIPTAFFIILLLPFIGLFLWLGSLSFNIQTGAQNAAQNEIVSPSKNIKGVYQDNIYNYVIDKESVNKCQPDIIAKNFNHYYIFPSDGLNGVVFWGNQRTGDLVWYTSRFNNTTKDDFLPNSQISSTNLCIIEKYTNISFGAYTLSCENINSEVICKDNYKSSEVPDIKKNNSSSINVKKTPNKVDNSLMNELFRKGGVSYE